MDHKDLCEHTKIRLIAAAVSHQQCTKTAANIIPLPGTDRVIAIGTPAEVCGLLADAPLTTPAPLTDALAAVKLLRDAINKQLDPSYICVSDHPSLYAALHATERFEKAAPAPQQSELTDERIEAIWNSIDGKAVITGENQMNWNSALRRAFACAIEREVAKAAPAAPVQTAEQGKFAERLYGPAPSVDERRDALHTLALIFAAAESDSAREACFEDMYREFLAVPRMSIFDSLTRHTGAEISTNHTFELDEFYEVDAVARVLAELSLTAPVQTSLEFTAELDRLLGRWASAAEDGSTSHEAIREKIISFIRVAAPVQAEQAQAETNTESVLDTLWQRVTDAREAAYTFGDTCKEAVEIALDGVLDMLVQADLALPAQAEQAAAVRAAEWMPIATVPMDGTEVLLYLPAPYNRVVKARWFDVWENWIEGDFPDPQDEYCGIGSQLPTHWTHLPAAPSTATSNDTGALGDTGGGQ